MIEAVIEAMNDAVGEAIEGEVDKQVRAAETRIIRRIDDKFGHHNATKHAGVPPYADPYRPLEPGGLTFAAVDVVLESVRQYLLHPSRYPGARAYIPIMSTPMASYGSPPYAALRHLELSLR